MIIISVIDALGFYPTFRKSYHKPWEEFLTHYSLASIKFLLSLFALEQFNLTTTLYPASLIFMNAAFLAMTLWRRRVLPRKAAYT